MSQTARRHQPQHRPQKDTAKAQELNDLRRENHKLKRDAARLQKDLAKALQTGSGFQGASGEAPAPRPKKERPAGCPGCGEAVVMRVLTLGPNTWVICPECKVRRKA